MAKRKLRIHCAFAGCSESFFMYMSSQKEVAHHILVYRGWLCNTHKSHLTPLALDAAIQPPAEHVQNSDIIPAGEVDIQPRQ